MWKAKYIIGGHMEQPIVFPETITHADMARNMGWVGEDRCVVGAGFIFLDGDEYKTYGESVSLRVKSRGETDEWILNRYLGGRYDE